MAAIKSFTTLEQSKKLAEILPLESADMHYYNDWLAVDYYKNDQEYYDKTLDKYIPAWSLAVLLDVLPILDNRSPVIPKTFDGKYRVVYHSTACERGIFTHDYDNPIDACYEMILKLHKLNLL